MMNAKDQFIDFINFAFMLIFGAAIFFYFVVGDNFFYIGSFLKIFLPVSFCGMVFFVMFKVRRIKIKALKRENNIDQEITCITGRDIIKDKFVIFLVGIMIILIALFEKQLRVTDYLQAISVFFIVYMWHKYLFSPQAGRDGRAVCLTRLDKIKDELVIFSLPLVITLISLVDRKLYIYGQGEVIDFYQAAFTFLAMYSWHRILFKERELN